MTKYNSTIIAPGVDDYLNRSDELRVYRQVKADRDSSVPISDTRCRADSVEEEVQRARDRDNCEHYE